MDNFLDVILKIYQDEFYRTRERLQRGEFTDLTSGFVTYEDISNCVNVNKDDIRQSEKELVENMTRQLYSFLLSNSMVVCFSMSKVKLKSTPVTVKDYSNVILETINTMKEYNQGLKKEFKDEDMPKHFYLIFSDPDYRDLLDDTIKKIDTFVQFFESAKRAESVYSNKYVSDKEFLRLIEVFNTRMEKSLTSAQAVVKNWDTTGMISKGQLINWNTSEMKNNNAFGNLVEGFKGLSSSILKSAKEICDEQEKSQKEQKKEVGKVVSEAEQQRLKTIKEANSLYDELINDTMRDLQSQVPYSAKDMYEYFVSNKLAKFKKEHKMPLLETASLKQAQEVVSQLNNLFNYVSKISENARVSIYFGNDRIQ